MLSITKSVLLFLSSLVSVHAQVKTVWQVGIFDQSPLEFSSPAQDSATYVVGKSDWKKDWPGTQGLRHPFQVHFSLATVEREYVLRIAALIEQPRTPTLRIGVNGHVGTFYFHPSLTYYPGDPSFAYHPNYSTAEIKAEIPAAFLKAGENIIEITCLDDPPATSEEEQFSTITYDALSLTAGTADPSRRGNLSAILQPTVFYRKSTSGLREIVDVFICDNGLAKPGEADLEIGGNHYSANLRPQDFGEQILHFEVPEWNGSTVAKLHVRAGASQTFEFTVNAARKWTLFVVPHTHLDIGYTDYQGKIAETQARVLAQAGALIHEHPDFRFSMDGSWNIQQLLETRPQAKQEEILDLIRNGKMAMPAQYCNLLTGYASLETLYRSLYKSKELAKRYSLPFEYANITDVPTYSGSYPSVLAASGVKYWVAAANNDRAPIFYRQHWNERSPFWWEGPDGGKVLFWYSWAYLQVQTLFGLPPSLNAVRESLPVFLQAYSNTDYKLDTALIYGTQVENTDLFPSTATFATEWNRQYAYPQLRCATFPEFFHYVENRYGKELPTYRKDGGPYWEDGIASDARFAAEDRTNENRALSAEILSTATHSVDADLNPPKDLLSDIWRNIILFAEHTWLSYNSITQPDYEESIRQVKVKDSRADRASIEIDDVMNRSLSQLADNIYIPSDTLVVFNSLNWRRDLVVETDLFEHPKLVDLTTQKEVPLEVIYAKEKFLHVRFPAKEVPAVGYKCFRIEYGKEGGPVEAQRENDRTVENAFYRITIDEATGALSSIYDKQLQREIVDAKSPYKFGQYLYVTGGDGNTRIINPFPALPGGEPVMHPSSHGKLLDVKQLAWGKSIRMISSDENTPQIETEILLFNSQKKIEFRFKVQKDYTTAKEAVYFAFPASVSKPHFAFASQQGWVDPAKDLLKGGSLEWFTVQQWMAVHNPDLAVGIVPLDAPLATFGDINRGKWPEQFNPPSATIFSYAMNNYWDTNYRAGQSGDFTFRFVVTSSRTFDGAVLTRLGLEEMRPAEWNYVVAQDKIGDPPRPLPAAGTGFLETNAQDIALVTWKQAEDGNGTILRLAETGGRASETALQFPHWNIASARLCSGVEDDNSNNLPVENGTIHLAFRPFEVLTLRVVGHRPPERRHSKDTQ